MATVKDILGRKGRDVVTIVADDSVLSAARLMNKRGIGGVVVLEDDEVIGIFTERDILRRVVAERRDPTTTLIRDVMTTPVMTCKLEAKLEECTALMTDKRVRHIPVVDADGLCGIVTSGDILAYQVSEQADTIQYLNSYVFDLRT
ncbi:MAG: CBS domain-containing protein [Gemmatimonadota bacterium]|nr:CBS domain-containing protein [Gemmatimonadota bacterium]MDH3367667.1 CBS domain-containing protein [Gemmatimonadota bacterium]MDH3478598.1 CBS domain-containing protein [Gemmatimonadota bacterium]MDH3569549.1 CBS domain-containing protein [Gemmatimonadota bacterium]